MARRVQEVDPHIAALALQLDEAKNEARVWAAEATRLETELIAAMEQIKSVTVPAGIRESLKVTRVSGDTVIVDPTRLKKRIGPRIFNQLLSWKLDPNKVEAAITTDLVSAEVVAECSTVKPKKTYILLTRTRLGSGTRRLPK